jgi:hypothetical protein
MYVITLIVKERPLQWHTFLTMYFLFCLMMAEKKGRNL